MEKKTFIPAVQVKEVMLGLSEDSIRERKKRVRSGTSLEQTQKLFLMTNKRLDNMVPEKKFTKFNGSTKGNLLAFVTLPSYDNMWCLPPEHRVKVYAHADGTRRAAGGGEADDQAEQGPQCVFYNTLPCLVWQELGAAYQARAFVDLAAGSGEVAKAALQLRRPCLAVCLSESHQSLLMEHLVEYMQECMADQGNTFFSAKYADFRKGKSSAGTGAEATEKKPAAADGAAKKASSKAKAAKKDSDSSESEEKKKTKKKKKRKAREASSSSSDS